MYLKPPLVKSAVSSVLIPSMSSWRATQYLTARSSSFCPTNDSWYGDSSAVTLHHNHAVLRATESGRYIVRAASTGISSVISPTGQKITSLGVNEEGYIYGDVEMKSDKTLFIVFGDIFVLFCAALIMTGAVMTAVPRVGKLRSNVGEKLKNAKIKRGNKEKKENSD